MKCLRQQGAEVIFSNVLIDVHNKPRWMGDGEPAPEKGINFQGEWTPAMDKVPMSHPNSRCTLRAETVGNHNQAANADPQGRVRFVVGTSPAARAGEAAVAAAVPDEPGEKL